MRALKQVRRLDLVVGLNDSNFVDRVLEHRRLDMSERRNFSRGLVGCLLNYVTDVTL